MLDRSGAVIARATVNLRPQESQQNFSTTADAFGHFIFLAVPCETYTLEITALGFARLSSTVYATEIKSISSKYVLPVSGTVETIQVDSSGASGKAETPRNPTNLTWNGWFESLTRDKKPLFKPVPKLQPQSDYLFTLDLAAIAYSNNAKGVYSKLLSAGLSESLKSLHGQNKKLDVLILPEASGFDVQKDEDRYTWLWVDGKKVKDASSHDWKMKGPDVFQVLAKTPEPKFEFGRVSVRLRTTSKTGMTHVAAVFWYGGLPFDEITVPVCVAREEDESCPSGGEQSYSLAGENVAAILPPNVPVPDVALDFVELDSQHLVGVLKCNHCSESKNIGYRSWQMSQSAADLSAYLASTLVTQFNAADSEDAYLSYGRALFNRIFKQAADGGVVPEAALLSDALKDSGMQASSPSPTLFVRFLASRPEPLFLAPIGLMVLPGNNVPVAQQYQMIVPLEHQSYPSELKCVGNWDILSPNDDAGSWASDVNQAFGKWTKTSDNWHVFHDIKEFRTAMSRVTGERAEDAVVTVSHHAANKLFWDEESMEPSIDPDQIQIPLPSPSLVVLNGCGTQGPGQSEFVRQFNARGASTIIASYYQVDTKLAGAFLSNLLEELRANPSADISHAVKSAQDKVRKDYGLSVYAYSVLGDPRLRACVPAVPNNAQPAPSDR